MRGADTRSPEALAYRRLYGTARWKRTRLAQLQKQPLCERCLSAKPQRITAATVCDHLDPRSKANPEAFFAGPFQSLCDADPWRCHSSAKQAIEKGGKPRIRMRTGADGWPE